MTKQLIRISTCISLATLITGCANHIRDYDEATTHIDRELTETKYDVLYTPDSPVSSTLSATAVKIDTYKVDTHQIAIHGELVTPYQGIRELYEFPCGIILVPVSVASHALSLATVNIYPFSVSTKINNVAFTGLNIFTNWESGKRTERNVLTSESQMIASEDVIETTALPDTEVKLVSGEKTTTYLTDELGTFPVALIGLDKEGAVFNMTREFDFLVAGDNAQITKRLLITRTFAGKLLHARSVILQYDRNPSGELLGKSVLGLEALGFNELAYALEKREIAKYDDDMVFIEAFHQASITNPITEPVAKPITEPVAKPTNCPYYKSF